MDRGRVLARLDANVVATASSGEYPSFSRHDRVRSLRRPAATYHDRAENELFRLCAALGFEDEYERYLAVQRDLFAAWGTSAIANDPPYASEIGDDHSPYEFSLQFEPSGVELRLLVEAQGAEPAALANHHAALELNRRLQERYSLDMERFGRVADLFLPDEPAAPFSLWHAVCWAPGAAPSFKLYLNPRARGGDRARALVEEALVRLGFGAETRAHLARVAGSANDEFRYFSLDLSPGQNSRVKVYVTHHGAGAEELEQVMSVSRHHVPGDVPRFCDAMTAYDGPFAIKPVTTCISFVEGAEQPYAMTLHLPIAHYQESDQSTAARVARFLRDNGLDDMSYRRAINVFAPRALDEGAGVQSYASYRREAGGLHFTAYLSPELFRPMTQPSARDRAPADARKDRQDA
jgi:DMATS type aromatic prenyltransferase